ncbi:MAG: sulfur carrier protein ThiS [Rickettsiales bacterium]
MQITLNGEKINISDKMTIANLLTEFALSAQKVAVELNQEIIPIEDYKLTILKENDHIEIVEFVGGG